MGSLIWATEERIVWRQHARDRLPAPHGIGGLEVVDLPLTRVVLAGDLRHRPATRIKMSGARAAQVRDIEPIAERGLAQAAHDPGNPPCAAAVPEGSIDSDAVTTANAATRDKASARGNKARICQLPEVTVKSMPRTTSLRKARVTRRMNAGDVMSPTVAQPRWHASDSALTQVDLKARRSATS